MKKLEEERIEVTVGDTKKPLFHAVATVENLLMVMEKFMNPPMRSTYSRPYVLQPVKESTKIRLARQSFEIERMKLQHIHNQKLAKLRFEEEMVIDHLKKEEEEKSCKE